ncbi:hypothetical protein SAMN05216327_104159 [Dyadobacter sp. SG02]|uniref:hypothetical protein n=1 Tax=Dyadobacter sp. SG02 TaxID=1855291 RepID=UPI0008C2AB41|nr:hypothetical protein [Dyadobacter sp. SG02]SEI83648.1 hypothetical protein SAMN05216327_104159 [Dyadobacter sp. SG02]
MKKIEEQLESIEELLSVMIRENASIVELIQKSAESQSNILANAVSEVKGALKQYSSGQLLESRLSIIQKRIEGIPATLQVKNHHYFDLRSKGFIISAALLLIVTALSVAVAISSYRETSRLRESDLKFRIARQLSPVLTARVDSIYYKDPDQAELETQRLEARKLSIKEAEVLLKQKQKEIDQAEKTLKMLTKTLSQKLCK